MDLRLGFLKVIYSGSQQVDKTHKIRLTKSKVPVAYGRNSVSDLVSRNDVATIGRIDKKTWRKC